MNRIGNNSGEKWAPKDVSRKTQEGCCMHETSHVRTQQEKPSAIWTEACRHLHLGFQPQELNASQGKEHCIAMACTKLKESWNEFAHHLHTPPPSLVGHWHIFLGGQLRTWSPVQSYLCLRGRDRRATSDSTPVESWEKSRQWWSRCCLIFPTGTITDPFRQKKTKDDCNVH
jgi:hypothetical protein